MGIPLDSLSNYRMFKGMIVIYVAVLTVAAAKDAKAFSLFNVVTFQNDACTSTSITTNSGARSGQCFTAEECTAKGGTASGGCAMGFGTCCLFTQTTCGGQLKTIALMFKMTVSPLLSQELHKLLSQTVTIKSTKLKQMCAVWDLTSLPLTLRLVILLQLL